MRGSEQVVMIVSASGLSPQRLRGLTSHDQVAPRVSMSLEREQHLLDLEHETRRRRSLARVVSIMPLQDIINTGKDLVIPPKGSMRLRRVESAAAAPVYVLSSSPRAATTTLTPTVVQLASVLLRNCRVST